MLKFSFSELDHCLPSGLLDISPCYYGFPIALSYPHFLNTDERVGEHVLGMAPNRSQHETYFYVQPVNPNQYFSLHFTSP